MSEFLFQYHEVKPTTWVYLSSLLMIGLYFKFSRFWSVRNLDLLLLILLAPGLLLVHFGKLQKKEAGAFPVRQVVSAQGARQPELPELTAADGQEMSTAAEAALGGSGSTAEGSGGTTLLAAAEPTGATAPSAAGNVEGPAAADGQSSAAASLPGDDPASAGLADGQTQRRWDLEYVGFIWLFGAGGLLLLRLLMDPGMIRRPLLEPNLSAGGLAFIGCSLFVFLMANVAADSADSPRFATTYYTLGSELPVEATGRIGYPLLWTVPTNLAKTMVIGAHLAVVLGLVAVGYRHFSNAVMGIGAATLYLMLPYTSLLTGRIDHVLPAAFLVWGIVCYRQPLISGLLIGVAGAFVFYPLFLLPLWLSFYWQRGRMRFLSGWLAAVGSMVALLVSVSFDPLTDLRWMFGLVPVSRPGLTGIWDSTGVGWDSVYQWPIVVTYVVFSLSLALWPAQKNLGTLLSCSSALMLGAQYWHGHDGGIYMAWYLPMVLLTIFRPNLEDRVALAVLGERRIRVRRPLTSVELAA